MSLEPGWTVFLCRSSPGAQDLADIVTSRGAEVTWCGPDCCPDQETAGDGDETAADPQPRDVRRAD